MVSSRARDRFKGGQVAALALWIAGWSLLVGQSCGGPPSPIQYVYDANGRLVAVVDPSQDSSGGGTAVYTYDGAGNLLSISRQQTTALFVLSFSPGCGTAGSPGTTVNIYGTGFTTSSTVKFNGVPAGSVTFVSATQLTATVPPSGASTGPITVSGVSNPNLGSFMVGCGAPTITSFTTCSGQTCSSTTPNCCIGAGATPTTGGTVVTITGTNFDQTASNDRLTFYHNRLASVGTPTMQQIMTTAPANVTSGKLQLTTPSGLAVSPLDFFAPPPNTSYTVASIDPNQAVRLLNPSSSGVSETLTMPTNDAAGNTRIGLALFDAAQGDLPCWYISDSGTLTNPTLDPNGQPQPWVVNFELYDPDGIPTPLNTGLSGPPTPQHQPLGITLRQYFRRPLAATGTYTLVTNPSHGTTGTLMMTAYNSTASIKNVIPTAAGATVSVPTAGPCQETWFRFTEPQPGHRFTVTGTNLSPSNFSYQTQLFDAVGSGLYGASGGVICMETWAGPLAPGGYQLVLTGNDPGSPTGSVRLRLYDVVDPTTPITPHAGGSVNTTVTASAAGQNPDVTFQAASSTLRLSWTQPTFTSDDPSFNGAPSVTLYSGSNAVPVSSCGGSCIMPTNGGTPNAQYRVHVDFWSCSTGSLTLTVTE